MDTTSTSTSRSADPSTLAEPLGAGRARAVHYDISWTVDFVGKRLLGYVDVRCLRNLDPPPSGESWELVLDASENLKVRDVWVDGSALSNEQWTRDEARKHDVLGKAVRVQLSAGEPGSEATVRLFYETAAPDSSGNGGSSALQWLPPAQTAGKVFPYVFSQCQAIHARALLPCQDTCECKATYSAKVRSPSELNVLMSAVKSDEVVPAEEPEWEAPEGCGKGWSLHSFEQKIPVPPYLIAVVCADLDQRKVGPRSKVWSEPCMVEKSAWEFANTEQYIVAAEKYCGPYQWGVYDLLVLPPSFPYGGMENPCLTFVTPTLLAGDRSQEHVVAHEISHSWSGNLVTNETWEEFWLNEGLTVFTEMKLLREVCGQEEATLQCMDRLNMMKHAILRFGETHNFTRLIPDLKGGLDPDDAFSSVPYVKGMSALCLLESLVDGEEHFQPFVRSYFQKFGGKTVTSVKLRDYYTEYFREKEASDPALKGVSAKIAAVDWDELFYKPGFPAYMPTCDEGPLREATALAQKWLEVQKEGPDAMKAKLSAKDIEGWGSTKISNFLDQLLPTKDDGSADLKPESCELMATLYGFLNANNEVVNRFVRIALGAKWAGAVPAALSQAAAQGRMKYTRPLYRALKKYDIELARKTFNENRSSYHPICAKMLLRDLEEA